MLKQISSNEAVLSRLQMVLQDVHKFWLNLEKSNKILLFRYFHLVCFIVMGNV